MRRKDKEILNKEELYSIMEEAKVCRLGLARNNKPYVIPLNFGYKDDCLYFHSAKQGKKIDILKENDRVGFEIDILRNIRKADTPCEFGTTYSSIIGQGKGEIINDIQEKRKGLEIIINHYSSEEDYKFQEKMLKRIVIIKVRIEELSGKKSE